MVLHNSKWDRKATRNYKKKHGIQQVPPKPRNARGAAVDATSAGGAAGESESDLTGSDGENSESASESEEEIGVEGVAATEERVAGAGGDQTSSNAVSGETQGAADSEERPIRRKKKHLPSNAWRYEMQEADEEYGVNSAHQEEEENYQREISQAAGDALARYLDAEDKKIRELEERESELADIFESQLDIDGQSESAAGRKKKAVVAPLADSFTKKGAKVVTYDSNDPSFYESDRRIEKLKFTEAVRDRYKHASVKERDAELERLKRLPKQVAFTVKKEREKEQSRSQADDFDDDFWKEIDQEDSGKRDSATVQEFTGKAATIRPAVVKGWGSRAETRPRETKTSAEIPQVQGSTTSSGGAPADDKFLDDLLQF
ncbi:hypothetical protein BZA70DRAFT_273573 [Myxozyma melibiosi]|uniref:Uncharacterized protein n=1 Tax=Myxozyma melibiosi TaxID=54550 RepID=A0ABR1FEX8_9ASCO